MAAGSGVRSALVLGLNATPRVSQVELLEAGGWTVKLSASLSDAVNVLQVWSPDVLLLDADKGSEEERKFLRAALDTRPDRRLPVVMMLGRSDLSAMVCAVREGADAVFVRPVSPARLWQRLKRLGGIRV